MICLVFFFTSQNPAILWGLCSLLDQLYMLFWMTWYQLVSNKLGQGLQNTEEVVQCWEKKAWFQHSWSSKGLVRHGQGRRGNLRFLSNHCVKICRNSTKEKFSMDESGKLLSVNTACRCLYKCEDVYVTKEGWGLKGPGSCIIVFSWPVSSWSILGR